MNAIVLAGGFGSRLKPLTDACPKPMLRVANRPMLDYVVAQLNNYGIVDMVFTLGYLPEQVEEHAGSYRGVKCEFTVETEPLGTAGGVKAAEKLLDDVFVVISGDALSNIDLEKMLEQHFNSGASVTMATTTVPDPRLYGVVRLDEANRVVGFAEKPQTAEYGNLVNAGVYVVNKSVLEYVPKNVMFDFSRDLFPQLVESGELSAYLHNGYWCDIGDKESYYRANFFMKNGGFYDFLPSFDAQIYESKATGDNLINGSAVTVGNLKSCIVGRDARIASNADLYKCIVTDGALVTGKHAYEIIGADYDEKLDKIEAKAHVEENYYSNLLFSGY